MNTKQSVSTLTANLIEIIGADELVKMVLGDMGVIEATNKLDFICWQLAIEHDEDGNVTSVDGKPY